MLDTLMYFGIGLVGVVAIVLVGALFYILFAGINSREMWIQTVSGILWALMLVVFLVIAIDQLVQWLYTFIF